MQCCVLIHCFLPHNPCCCFLPLSLCMLHLFICTCLNTLPVASCFHLVSVCNVGMPLLFYWCIVLEIIMTLIFMLSLNSTDSLLLFMCWCVTIVYSLFCFYFLNIFLANLTYFADMKILHLIYFIY